MAGLLCVAVALLVLTLIGLGFRWGCAGLGGGALHEADQAPARWSGDLSLRDLWRLAQGVAPSPSCLERRM